jgi:hypothetical protein
MSELTRIVNKAGEVEKFGMSQVALDQRVRHWDEAGYDAGRMIHAAFTETSYGDNKKGFPKMENRFMGEGENLLEVATQALREAVDIPIATPLKIRTFNTKYLSLWNSETPKVSGLGKKTDELFVEAFLKGVNNSLSSRDIEAIDSIKEGKDLLEKAPTTVQAILMDGRPSSHGLGYNVYNDALTVEGRTITVQWHRRNYSSPFKLHKDLAYGPSCRGGTPPHSTIVNKIKTRLQLAQSK